MTETTALRPEGQHMIVIQLHITKLVDFCFCFAFDKDKFIEITWSLHKL